MKKQYLIAAVLLALGLAGMRLADLHGHRAEQSCAGEPSKWHFEGDHTGDVLTATWTADDPRSCKR
jgi:hypothetical protein